MKTYPGLSAQPWHDGRRFDLVRDLERNAQQIIDEACRIDDNSFADEPEKIERRGRWSVFFLYERGRRNEANCARCPITTAIVEANRTVTSMAGMSYFSRLEPNTYVAPHKGPTNMRLRCHFGIAVPDGCGMKVDREAVQWKRGHALVFDDSFEHEVWNRSNEPRTILIVDVWHPDLSDEEVLLLDGLHRYASGQRGRFAHYWAMDESRREGEAVQ